MALYHRKNRLKRPRRPMRGTDRGRAWTICRSYRRRTDPTRAVAAVMSQFEVWLSIQCVMLSLRSIWRVAGAWLGQPGRCARQILRD